MAGRILLLLSVSSDSFCFGCAAGVLRIGETRLVRISLLFALCDGFALWLGYRLAIQNSVLHFILLPLCTGLVLFVFATAPTRGARNRWRWSVYLAPIALSTDNFLAASALTGRGLFAEVALGAVASGSLFLLGNGVTRWMRRALRLRNPILHFLMTGRPRL